MQTMINLSSSTHFLSLSLKPADSSACALKSNSSWKWMKQNNIKLKQTNHPSIHLIHLMTRGRIPSLRLVQGVCSSRELPTTQQLDWPGKLRRWTDTSIVTPPTGEDWGLFASTTWRVRQRIVSGWRDLEGLAVAIARWRKALWEDFLCSVDTAVDTCKERRERENVC